MLRVCDHIGSSGSAGLARLLRFTALGRDVDHSRGDGGSSVHSSSRVLSGNFCSRSPYLFPFLREIEGGGGTGWLVNTCANFEF